MLSVTVHDRRRFHHYITDTNTHAHLNYFLLLLQDSSQHTRKIILYHTVLILGTSYDTVPVSYSVGESFKSKTSFPSICSIDCCL